MEDSHVVCDACCCLLMSHANSHMGLMSHACCCCLYWCHMQGEGSQGQLGKGKGEGKGGGGGVDLFMHRSAC